MCGIAGIYQQKSLINNQLVEEMTNALEHRGPDASGLFQNEDETCILGHRRLSIIDLSQQANQPLQLNNKGYTIVFNGEIYNYKVIRKELEQHKVKFISTSDTEVVLKAFMHWGDDFAQRLNGMFSIAIYDKNNKSLKIFRDRLGIKPLYYYESNGLFAFASELKGLLPLIKEVGKFNLNIEAVNSFFRLGYIPEPQSIYKEVKKFPAGGFAKIDESGLHLKNYWEITDNIEEKTISRESQAKKTLNKLIASSVRDRLVSDVPFGVFLSGGIDSSTVAAFANKESSDRINTFSIGFREKKFDESRHAREVAKSLNTNHSEFIVQYDDALQLIQKNIDFFDEPFADSSFIPTHLIAREARKHVKMVLTGDGGDEQFMGYGMYTWANRMNRFNSPFLNPLIKSILQKSNSRGKRVASMFDFNKLDSIESHVFSVEQYLFNANEWKNTVKKEIYSPLQLPLLKSKRVLSVKEKQALFDLKYYLKDDLLVKVDRSTMAASLEARTPLLDHRIIHFSMNLDEGLKVKNKTEKYLLKQVLYDYLPQQLFDRPKWGFSIPLNQWMTKELKSLILSTIYKDKLDEVGIFNTKEVLHIVDQFFKGDVHLYNKVWLIYVFITWWEKNAKYLS
jgi:asparagine synthase (glutamine-hydrolysing)